MSKLPDRKLPDPLAPGDTAVLLYPVKADRFCISQASTSSSVCSYINAAREESAFTSVYLEPEKRVTVVSVKSPKSASLKSPKSASLRWNVVRDGKYHYIVLPADMRMRMRRYVTGNDGFVARGLPFDSHVRAWRKATCPMRCFRCAEAKRRVSVSYMQPIVDPDPSYGAGVETKIIHVCLQKQQPVFMQVVRSYGDDGGCSRGGSQFPVDLVGPEYITPDWT